MKRFSLLILALPILLLACTSKGGNAARFVPSNAFGALVIQSPADLFMASDSFLSASSLIELTGQDGSLKDQLFSRLKAAKDGSIKTLEAIDFAKPVVISFVPATEPDSIAAVLWLPLKDSKESFTRVQEDFAQNGGNSALVDGYAAICWKQTAPTALPSKTADLSRLDRFSTKSLKVWLNLSAIRAGGTASVAAGFKDSLSPTEKADKNSLAPRKETGAADLFASTLLDNPMLAGLKDFVDEFDDEVSGIYAALELDDSGARIAGGVTFTPGSRLADFSAGAGKGIPYLRYLDADALAAGASSFSADPDSEFMKAYQKLLTANPVMGANYSTVLSAIGRGVGSDQAVNFDLSLAPDFLQKAKGLTTLASIATFIREAFSIQYQGLFQIRDESKLREGLALLSQGDLFGETVAQTLASSGIEVGFDVTQGEVDQLQYDKLRLKISSSQLDTLEGEDREAAQALLNVISDKLTFMVGYKGSEAWLSMGTPEDLAALSASKGPAHPASSDARFNAVFQQLPTDTFGIGYISLKETVSLVKSFTPLPIKSENLDRLYFYASGTKGALELGAYISASDIRIFVDAYQAGKAGE